MYNCSFCDHVISAWPLNADNSLLPFIQKGEEELPDEPAAPSAEPAAPAIDEAVVAQLADMGFALEGCKKAVFNTKNSGNETVWLTVSIRQWSTDC